MGGLEKKGDNVLNGLITSLITCWDLDSSCVSQCSFGFFLHLSMFVMLTFLVGLITLQSMMFFFYFIQSARESTARLYFCISLPHVFCCLTFDKFHRLSKEKCCCY